VAGVSSTETTRATLHELLSRLGRFEPEPVAALFADTVDWDVPGDERVPWTGTRSSRDEVAAYFRTLWSVCDTAQADTAVSQMLVDGADAVVLGVFKQTIRATGRRFSTPVALHITVADGVITRLRMYEDSHAVARAYAEGS
jgi:ketosteroid isomerase-like protein